MTMQGSQVGCVCDSCDELTDHKWPKTRALNAIQYVNEMAGGLRNVKGYCLVGCLQWKRIAMVPSNAPVHSAKEGSKCSIKT